MPGDDSASPITPYFLSPFRAPEFAKLMRLFSRLLSPRVENGDAVGPNIDQEEEEEEEEKEEEEEDNAPPRFDSGKSDPTSRNDGRV